MTPLTLPAPGHAREQGHGRRRLPIWTYGDYWGTFVSSSTSPTRTGLMITAQATVETGQATGGLPAPLPWDGAARAGGADGRLLEFLLPTPLTTVTRHGRGHVEGRAARRRPGRGGRARSRPGSATQVGLHGRLHRRPDQRPGGLGPGPGRVPGHGARHRRPAARGRAPRPVRLRLPVPDPDATPGETLVGESHAWVEYWAGAWRRLDPTSGAPVRERHVVVARGRDYADIPPLGASTTAPPPARPRSPSRSPGSPDKMPNGLR